MNAVSSLKLASFGTLESGPQRVSSRSLSWNSSGTYLALAGSDRTARMFTVEESGVSREVLVIPHQAAVTKVRFRPNKENQLVTAASDKTVRLWDVRNASQRAMGKIDLHSGSSPVSVEWCPAQDHLLAITEQDGAIAIYDVRNLHSSPSNSTASGSGAASKTNPRPSALYSFSTGDDFPESCIFYPSDGNYLIVDSNAGGFGCVRVWKYESSTADAASAVTPNKPIVSYPSHAPLYSMQFSPCGTSLATGGVDATVCIWDTATMCCRHVVSRHIKLIRSVAFSPDSRILASASEELIDLADATNGALVGQVSASTHRSSRPTGGEEAAFYPKRLDDGYLLACARSESPAGPTPLVILKLSINDTSTQ